MVATMLRSLPRAAPSSSAFLPRTLHTPSRFRQPATTYLSSSQPRQTRAATAHAISNPTLAGIEKRWEAMPPQEQADLWMALRDRMKVDWHELTVQEKKAGTYRHWISAFRIHNEVIGNMSGLCVLERYLQWPQLARKFIFKSCNNGNRQGFCRLI